MKLPYYLFIEWVKLHILTSVRLLKSLRKDCMDISEYLINIVFVFLM